MKYDPFVLDATDDLSYARFAEDLADHMLDRGLESEARAMLKDFEEWVKAIPDPRLEDVLGFCNYHYHTEVSGQRSPYDLTWRESVEEADAIEEAASGAPVADWSQEARLVNQIIGDMAPEAPAQKRHFIAFVDDGDDLFAVIVKAIHEMAEVDIDAARRLAIEIGWVAEDPKSTSVDYGEVLMSYCQLQPEHGSKLESKLGRRKRKKVVRR